MRIGTGLEQKAARLAAFFVALPRGYHPGVDEDGDLTMQHEDFEAVIRDTLGKLPDWVHDALDNIEVLVLDEPDDELDPEGHGLLGLYTGLPLPERGAAYAGELPDVIYIFRKPHLALNLPPDDLRAEIVTTLIHEIAHYFGIDDDHLDELGWG